LTEESSTEADPPYRILMVCTGNICRSPFMERLLRMRLREGLGVSQAERFRVDSAGSWALVNYPMEPAALTTLRARGGDAADFYARALTVEMIEAADLILTATREHRGIVVTESPRAAGKTLTLREFARLLGPVTVEQVDAEADVDPVARMRAIARAAFGNRGLVPLIDPTDDDIGDPYGRPQADYDRAAAQIDAALAVPISLLLGR
jgi:protein-tyrosine phosphatase